MQYSSSILKSIAILFIGMFAFLCTTRAEISPYPNAEEQIVMQYISEYSTKPLAVQVIRKISQTVYYYADKNKIDPMLVLALMRQESDFNPNATSKEGAKGLMQVLPRAHRHELKGKSVTNIETNVELGTQIYADCLKMKGNIRGALNCYSGGGGKKYLNGVLAYEKHAQRYVLEHMFRSDDIYLASN